MKLLIMCVLIQLYSTAICAPSKLEPLRIVRFKFQNSEYSTSIFSGDLDKSVLWLPTQANPPLAVRSAMEFATKYVKSRFNDADGWYVDRTSLEPIRNKDEWIYVVEMNLLPKDDTLGSGVNFPFKVVVLMNGAVMPVKQELK